MNSVKHRTETITILSAKIWKVDNMELTSLSMFKFKMNILETSECPSRLSKTYIQRVGFI